MFAYCCRHNTRQQVLQVFLVDNTLPTERTTALSRKDRDASDELCFQRTLGNLQYNLQEYLRKNKFSHHFVSFGGLRGLGFRV